MSLDDKLIHELCSVDVSQFAFPNDYVSGLWDRLTGEAIPGTKAEPLCKARWLYQTDFMFL